MSIFLYLVVFLPKIPYVHRIYVVLANPVYKVTHAPRSPNMLTDLIARLVEDADRAATQLKKQKTQEKQASLDQLAKVQTPEIQDGEAQAPEPQAKEPQTSEVQAAGGCFTALKFIMEACLF